MAWKSAMPSAYFEPLWPISEDQRVADLRRYYNEQEPRFNALIEAYRPYYERQLAQAKGGDTRYGYLTEREGTGVPWWSYYVPQKLFEPWKQWLAIAPFYGASPQPYPAGGSSVQVGKPTEGTVAAQPIATTQPQYERPPEAKGYWDWVFGYD